MNFTLFYSGKLTSNSDKREKHRIRVELHPQLKALWNQEPLKTLWLKKENNRATSELIDIVGDFQYVPIVRTSLKLFADLEIEFLRCGAHGELLQGGDLDNRLKTLFDALRKPNNESEIPNDDEFEQFRQEPMYCLLEDDQLISSLTVNTHQLLTEEESNHVVLLIKVVTKQTQVIWDNLGL